MNRPLENNVTVTRPACIPCFLQSDSVKDCGLLEAREFFSREQNSEYNFYIIKLVVE